MIHITDYLLLIPTLAVVITFVVAAYYDMKNRSIPFRIWFAMVVISTPFIAAWYWSMWTSDKEIFYISLSTIVLLCGIFYFLGRLKFVGGADAMGMIFLTICLPGYAVEPLTGVPAYGLFPISALVNTLFFAVILLPIFILMNSVDDEKVGIPFVVPMALGIVTALIVGDIATLLLLFFLPPI